MGQEKVVEGVCAITNMFSLDSLVLPNFVVSVLLIFVMGWCCESSSK